MKNCINFAATRVGSTVNRLLKIISGPERESYSG
jgi:hypothetical protein